MLHKLACYISRVPDQNGISQTWYIVEIHHSGQKSSISRVPEQNGVSQACYRAEVPHCGQEPLICQMYLYTCTPKTPKQYRLKKSATKKTTTPKPKNRPAKWERWWPSCSSDWAWRRSGDWDACRCRPAEGGQAKWGHGCCRCSPWPAGTTFRCRHTAVLVLTPGYDNSNYNQNNNTICRLRTWHCQLLSHLYTLKISHSEECPCSTGPQTPQPHPAVLPHLWHFETPDMVQSSGCPQELWGPAKTLQHTADFVLLTGLKI